jgi:methyl-accepting chemotaxis protein
VRSHAAPLADITRQARTRPAMRAQHKHLRTWGIFMNLIRNLNIGPRLGVGFGIVLAFMAVMILMAVTRFNSVGQATGSILHKDWIKADAAATLNATTRANAQRTMELFFVTDEDHFARVHDAIDTNKKVVTEALATLDKLVYAPQGKALLHKIKEERVAYVASFSKIDRLLQEGNVVEAKQALIAETLPAIDALHKHIKAFVEFQRELVVATGSDIEHHIEFTRNLMFGVGLAVMMLCTALAWWLTRSITRPIHEAVKIAETVAAGDLTSRIEVPYRDETGKLLSALRSMNESLVKVVGTVRASSDSIATGSNQISTGNLDLSQRTEEQASNLQQTAASMEQLSSTVKLNSDTACQAAALAASASAVAMRGGVVVGHVVGTMQLISTSSKKISDIIGVIDGIAFQTNILALNAAVEAARAGDQGRGFAVVAAEVRSLAQRCTSAAKEIKTLINDSVEKVDVGSQQVGEAGRTMDDIVTQVKRVNALITDISSATAEQTMGINQVSDAVVQLDQVTQQNAALVEESAAAAQSLSHQAKELVKAVATFRLEATAEAAEQH